MLLNLPDSPAITDKSAIAGFYAEFGFYHARGVFDAASVGTLEHDFDHIVEQLAASGEVINARWNNDNTTALDGGETEVIHTHQVQKYSAAWAQVLFDPRLLDIAEVLLGHDIVMHHTKLFLKPAGRGAAFPPHQDYGYFPTVANSMLAANIALTPQDEANGCLRVWPGSHLLGPQQHSMGGDTDFAARFPIADSIPVVCAPGDLIIFSYLTVHGSLANRSPRPRKHVLVQLFSGKDKMHSPGHPCSDLVLRGRNHHMTRNGANCS